MSEPLHHRKQLPFPPLVIQGFLILFSFICMTLSIAYGVEIKDAPTYSWFYINNTWESTGSGVLYFLPAPLTLALTITNTILYNRASTPMIYSLSLSLSMFSAWVIVLIFWTQCHANLWGALSYDDHICYQRSLRPGRRGQTYRGVSDSLAYAGMAFGCLVIIMYAFEAIGTGVELRRGRKVGVWRYGVAPKRAERNRRRGVRSRGEGGADLAALGGFWAMDGGDGGGGGGDGGGGGGDGGGGGGGDGGGC